MPEAADELGRTDEDKIVCVMEATRRTEASDRGGWIRKRRGKPDERNIRPIHMTVNNQKQRDCVFKVAKHLKAANKPLSRVQENFDKRCFLGLCP